MIPPKQILNAQRAKPKIPPDVIDDDEPDENSVSDLIISKILGLSQTKTENKSVNSLPKATKETMLIQPAADEHIAPVSEDEKPMELCFIFCPMLSEAIFVFFTSNFAVMMAEITWTT